MRAFPRMYMDFLDKRCVLIIGVICLILLLLMEVLGTLLVGTGVVVVD